MSRKGIIGLGPALLFVNLFALLASVAAVISTLCLVSGITFSRKIKEMPKSVLAPRLAVFISLTILIIIAVHLIGGPTSNHYLGMVFGAIAFFAVIAVLSINSIRENAKKSFITISILTLLFLFIAEVSVFIALL